MVGRLINARSFVAALLVLAIGPGGKVSTTSEEVAPFDLPPHAPADTDGVVDLLGVMRRRNVPALLPPALITRDSATLGAFLQQLAGLYAWNWLLVAITRLGMALLRSLWPPDSRAPKCFPTYWGASEGLRPAAVTHLVPCIIAFFVTPVDAAVAVTWVVPANTHTSGGVMSISVIGLTFAADDRTPSAYAAGALCRTTSWTTSTTVVCWPAAQWLGRGAAEVWVAVGGQTGSRAFTFDGKSDFRDPHQFVCTYVV